MKRFIIAAILSISMGWAHAAEMPAEELSLVSAHAIDGMKSGNLSGLALCRNTLWAVSDRDDNRVYRLQFSDQDSTWIADREKFVAIHPPINGLPWGMRSRAVLSGFVRGGKLDFEGITCDAMGNRYLVSEAFAAVLMLPVSGEPRWLTLPNGVIRHTRAKGMLMHFNALLEGIAVDPDGKRLWLAAERERRGLLAMRQTASGWRCEGSCVLMTDNARMTMPQQPETVSMAIDFSDVVFFRDKLFTLERLGHRICRRSLEQGEAEKCWSFASVLLAPEHTYGLPYGLAEGLVVDDDGAWIGLDNGHHKRLSDGDDRPYVFRFAAPEGGWLGRK